MPRNSFLLILPILSGTACVYHYGEGTAPHDTGSSVQRARSQTNQTRTPRPQRRPTGSPVVW